MGIATTVLAWLYGWREHPTSSFRLALVPPYVILVHILICRVHRNTKLGLYKKVPVQVINASSQRRSPSALKPVKIAVTHVVEYPGDDSPATSQCVESYLDFGMV
jgi:hypothetical protein